MAKTLDAAGVKRLIQEIKGANKNLNAPIPISTENTPESMAQNVKNIADYVEKAKAAGIDTTKSFRITLEIDGYPVEGSYDIQYSYACGLQITDDGYALLYNIDVTTGEVFTPCEIVTARSLQKVTSSMLAMGARKPIILTPDTTEVDEETYQKLLSDDVDVVFKISTESTNLCTLTYKIDRGSALKLYFTCFSMEGEYVLDVYLYAYEVSITKASPHTCSITKNVNNSLDIFLDSAGYLNKFYLNQILQEIYLSGTDADRKAKLDQFETDWKALTGASDLTGARFVGQITTPKGGYTSVLFTYNAGREIFNGVTNLDDSDYRNHYSVYLDFEGVLTITPLFSHLEAITIKTNNSTESKVANVAAIKAYADNLTALGVDTTKGFLIPINVEGQGSGFISRLSGTDSYMGIMTSYGIPTFGIAVSVAGEYYSYRYQTDSDNSLTTESKQIVGAINEINANAVHSDKLVPTLEAITIYTDNTPEHMQANLDNIAAYEANLQALGVDTNNNYIIPIKFDEVDDEISFPFGGFITTYGGYEGFVTSTLAEHYKPKHIWISQGGGEEGKVYLDELAYENQLSVYTPKSLNAKSLEAITIKTGNTPEDKAANVAAIKAYVDNLIALGVDITKGYMIPFHRYDTNAYGVLIGNGITPRLQGYLNSDNTAGAYVVTIDGTVAEALIQLRADAYLTTTSKYLVDAINEVNALVKGYSTPIELTTETAQNKTAIDARVAAFTAQGISLTNGCCIPVTYKGVYAGNISLINGDWYGLLVKNTNNPADNINIKLSADGTIAEGNSAQ